MKRLLIVAIAIVAVLQLGAPGKAGTILDLLTFQSGVEEAQAVDASLMAPPNDGGHDFAVGGGQHTDGVNPVTMEGFSAHSGPSGENPQGHISATFLSPTPQKLRGDVICLQVVGNQAFILAVETRTDDVIPQGQQFFLHVVDNGNPASGAPPDLIRNSFVGFFTPPTTLNPCGLPVLPPVPLFRGNIVVHDEL